MIVTSENRLEFLHRFVIGRDDVYAIQTKDGRYRKVDKQLTDAALLRHLQHKITIGCYNSSTDNRCKYALIDVDSHEGKTTLPIDIVQQRVLKCLLTLKEYNVPHTLAESSPGSYHLVVYFDPPAKTAEAYDYVRWITRNAGEPDIEVFPKQREIPPGEYGNLVRLPCSLHQKKRTDYHYIDEAFHPIHEFVVEPVDITGFTSSETMKPSAADTAQDLCDIGAVHTHSTWGIPPCLSAALENNMQMTGGGGHFMRIAIVCAYRNAGLSFGQICKLFTLQEDYNPAETAKQVKSVIKKDGGYSYSCTTLQDKSPKFVTGMCKTCPRGKRFK